jgi:hypothetical protein
VSGALAYVPFLEPIASLQAVWYLLLVPLAFGIAVIYRALKLPTLDQYWRAVGTMTLQILLWMAALAVALVVVVQVFLPRLPVE